MMTVPENSNPTGRSEAQLVVFRADKLSPLLLRFLNRLKQNGKSVHTISAYRNDLSIFCQFLLEEKIDPRDFQSHFQERWIAYLNNHGRKSPASIRRALMSVRTFLHFLIKEKVIERSPLLETKSPRQPAHDLLIIRPEHYFRLLNTLSSKDRAADPKAVRDLALIQLLGECGLKASEASQMRWSDVLFEGDPKQESASVTLHVTGHNQRVVKGNSDIAQALWRLRETRLQLNLNSGLQDKLFFGFLNVSRKLKSDGLHRHGIKFIVYEICEEILGVPYNSESLRNHAILRWLEFGLSAQQVAQLAGYSSLNSLERFKAKTRSKRKPKRQSKNKTENQNTNSPQKDSVRPSHAKVMEGASKV
ncbi:MAG: hypothetical protein RIR26_1122 [Pseudomonadota bacterium]|jgi:site-specific recombinase XerD